MSYNCKPDGFIEQDEEFSIRLRSGDILFARELSRSGTPHETLGADGTSGVVLIVVHGGPGLADHTESFPGLRRALVECRWDRPTASSFPGGVTSVVFYDQLGCGRSDKPPEDGKYSLASYVDELDQVVMHVAERHAREGGRACWPMICLLGHRWGGQVVLELLLSSDDGGGGGIGQSKDSLGRLCCAVISNAPLDEATYEKKQRAMREKLDESTRRFYEEEEEAKAAGGSVGSKIYAKLIGASETNIVGEMRNWEAKSRLSKLRHPCLFITGDDDTIPFEEYEEVEKLFGSKCRSAILEGAGHGPFFGDNAELYFRNIRQFLLTHSVKHFEFSAKETKAKLHESLGGLVCEGR